MLNDEPHPNLAPLDIQFLRRKSAQRFHDLSLLFLGEGKIQPASMLPSLAPAKENFGSVGALPSAIWEREAMRANFRLF